jgi:uncharacterized membrane protein YkvA (DUF1232 family)
MDNRFFKAALNNAASLSGKKGRILLLIGKLGNKLRDLDWKNANAGTLKLKLSVLGRMSKAYALGHYRALPWKTILIILASIIYFLNPLDLIPDMLPVVGLTDDFGILVLVYNSIREEIDKFLLWEKSKLPIV